MAKRKPAQEEGVPEWVVTYGDLMSLLLCFFILLAAFSELKQDRPQYIDVIRSIKEAFGESGGVGLTQSPISPNSSAATPSDLWALKGVLKDIVDESTIKNMVGENTKVETVREGTKFTIGGHVTFDVGSAALKPAASADLERVAEIVRGRRFRIQIRGHAYGLDRQPEDQAGYDRLAFDRAAAVSGYLVETCGIGEDRISRESRSNHDPVQLRLYNAEEQAVNRRVEVILSEEVLDAGKGQLADAGG